MCIRDRLLRTIPDSRQSERQADNITIEAVRAEVLSVTNHPLFRSFKELISVFAVQNPQHIRTVQNFCLIQNQNYIHGQHIFKHLETHCFINL